MTNAAHLPEYEINAPSTRSKNEKKKKPRKKVLSSAVATARIKTFEGERFVCSCACDMPTTIFKNQTRWHGERETVQPVPQFIDTQI